MSHQSYPLLKYTETYDRLVMHFSAVGSPELVAAKETWGITRASFDWHDADWDVKLARQFMGDAYRVKKRAREDLLKAIRAIHKTAQQVLRHHPEKLDYLKIPRRGRPRKGEVRPVRLSAQGDRDVLRQGGRLAFKLLRDYGLCDLIAAHSDSGYALDEIEVLVSEFKQAIKQHQQKRLEWRKAIRVRNKKKEALKEWMRRVRGWASREALQQKFWADYIVCDRPHMLDRRFLTKEMRQRFRRLFYQRDYRERKAREARAKKREAFAILADKARDAIAGFG